MTFGISNEIIPVSVSGEVDRSVHMEWLKKRRNEHQEEVASDTDRVMVPAPFDVLFGRGKLIQEHVGNQRYRKIVESYRERYEQALKVEKTYIAKEIVQIVKDSGGRFLKSANVGWTEVSTDIAREKVSHSFRNRRIATSGVNNGWKEIRLRPVQVPSLSWFTPKDDKRKELGLAQL
jgi:hypothetical protein